MATRDTYTSAGPGPDGEAFADNLAAHIKKLYDASSLPLTAVAGTANAVTATLDPALDAGGLVDGMKFTISWAAVNTGGMTLALNGAAAKPVLDASGVALIAGAVAAGFRSELEYIGGNFRMLTVPLTNGGETARYRWQFTASGTWNKPAGLDPDTLVLVEAWGAGGGGNSSGAGGGGGSYKSRWFRLADLPSSVTVTVGAGGTGGGSAGGNSLFGTLLTAYGGGAAGSTNGGEGGSVYGVGGNGVNTAKGPNAANLWDGGGGSAPSNRDGGAALFGGGGGGSGGITNGGASQFGGAGGGNSTAGTAPGGGGGGGGSGNAGARGEVRVSI